MFLIRVRFYYLIVFSSALHFLVYFFPCASDLEKRRGDETRRVMPSARRRIHSCQFSNRVMRNGLRATRNKHGSVPLQPAALGPLTRPRVYSNLGSRSGSQNPERCDVVTNQARTALVSAN